MPTTYGDTTNHYFPHFREEWALRGRKMKKKRRRPVMEVPATRRPTSERRHRFHLGGVEKRVSAALVEPKLSGEKIEISR